MSKIAASLLLTTLLYGCATPPVAVKTETVIEKVEVTKPCPSTVNPSNPPAFPADDAAMKNLPYPDAAAKLHANPKDAEAKAQVDANVFYLLKIMSADRIATRAWADQLGTALKGCM